MGGWVGSGLYTCEETGGAGDLMAVYGLRLDVSRGHDRKKKIVSFRVSHLFPRLGRRLDLCLLHTGRRIFGIRRTEQRGEPRIPTPRPL